MGLGMETETSECEITEDEAALYDRQIRLWGLDAQKRLRKSKVLMVGIGGLGAEITKNLVLAGIQSITLLDNKNVTSLDNTAQFFVSSSDIGKNRAECSKLAAKQLNPMVDVLTDTNNIMQKDEEFFKAFDVVCATACEPNVLLHLNTICRKHSIKFFCGSVWGFYGYSFADLNHHTCVEEETHYGNKDPSDSNGEPLAKKPKSEKSEKYIRMVQKTLDFAPLEKCLEVRAGKSGTGLDKRTSSVFFLLHVIFRFCANKKRLPTPESREQDISDLLETKKKTLEELGIDEERLNNSTFSHVFGEISPVCAIVGGVLGQEVIKAVSGKGTPLKNFFLFNGEDGTGVVENISK